MKPLNKEILSLAIPSILANITVPLVGMADIAVAGHLGGGNGAAALIGGITIGTMLFDLLYWNFAFLRSGTGGLTAQAYGRLLAGSDGVDQVHGILLRALKIALLSGVALIALQWVVLWLAFLLVDCTPQVRELASEYFKIRIWAAPATLSLFAFKGWFIGLQDTVRPMIADLIVNGLNIALSFGLGFGLCGLPAMGFAGVAAGTLIAQWCGFTYTAFAARHAMGQLVDQVQVQQRPVDQVQAPSFFRMNRDLVLRSLGMIAVYIGFTVISAKFGDTMLAVSAILMKLLLVFSYFTDGFAYAGEALTGKFIGAGDKLGVHAAVKGCFIWGWGLAGAFIFTNLFGHSNDIYMQISLIMLIGLLAKNAILIVQFALERRQMGMAISWSAVLGAGARLRPILMTSLAMVIGLLPMMFASGVGKNGNQTLGAAAVGGMFIGTLLQLFVVPVLFVIFQSLQEKIRPLKFDDDHANVDSELTQYTRPLNIKNKDYVK